MGGSRVTSSSTRANMEPRCVVCASCGKTRLVSSFAGMCPPMNIYLPLAHLCLLADKLATCEPCLIQKRRQHANRQARRQLQKETLQTEIQQFKVEVTKQTTEIAHLQSVLAVLQQNPEFVSDELLRNLLIDPSDAAVGCLVAVD